MDEEVPEDGFVLGGPMSRLAISVRVQGDDLDPEEITRVLGATPKFAARKGDQVRRGERTVTQRSGIWVFGLTEEPSPEWELNDAMVAILGRLSSDLQVWASLAARFKLDVFCGLFMSSDNQGADIAPVTLRLLAERGLTLDLDVYGPPPGETAT